MHTLTPSFNLVPDDLISSAVISMTEGYLVKFMKDEGGEVVAQG